MPIYLPAPECDPRGPDGKGWNRLSMTGGSRMCNDQCALQPRSYATLVESQDTRRARYGGFGGCGMSGNCQTCPVYHAPPIPLDRHAEGRVLIRIEDGHPREYVSPDHGLDSHSWPWTWQRLGRLEGWVIGPPFHDEWSTGFWLVSALPRRCTECDHVVDSLTPAQIRVVAAGQRIQCGHRGCSGALAVVQPVRRAERWRPDPGMGGAIAARFAAPERGAP